MRYLCAILFVLMVIRCQSPSSSDAGIRATSSARVIDWQGHRGARGLLPENTIPAFLKALEYPITTLELDVVISKDSQVIVSHEPWMSHEICNTPTGRAVKAEERSQFNLFEMTYEQIKGFDCGGRGNERFGEQQAIQTHKPSLLEAVTQVELYCQQKNITPPRYNIEIKSQPSHDNIFTPEPATFARLLLDDINALDIQSRTTIQSFDPRSLEAVHRQNASVQTAYLVYLPGVAE
ncbi:MAG: glycerophosphodiester phosphodiesterase family protein, partial [Bacteroidota bacterium]